MKIDMYTLLGMVKDGKAPKKIKYMGYSFEYDTNHKRYESYFDEQIWTLNDFVNVDDNLNEPVEILEEEKKKIKPLTKKDIEALGYACGEIQKCFTNGWDKSLKNKPFEEEKKIPEKLENEKKFYAYTRYEENKDEIDKVLYILKAINLTEEKIDNLNNSVNEIIDFLKSKEEKEIPEKLDDFTIAVGKVDESNIEEYIQTLFNQQYEIFNKINSIIDYLKSKGE